MELSFSKKGAPHIGGFHIDHMNRIEKSGILEFSNKVMHKDGFYSAELLFNGKTAKRTATFFPVHWTNEQVIDAIFEAYDNFIKKNSTPKIKPNGTFTIHGHLKNDIVIEIYLTKKGEIITAYPLLPQGIV